MGALAYNEGAVAPSPVRSRIGAFSPNELDEAGIEKQIADHAHCAKLALQAGYDGVEIIGSAGYLLSTFLVEKTNQRTDQWGGSYENQNALSGGGGASSPGNVGSGLHRHFPHCGDGYAPRGNELG